MSFYVNELGQIKSENLNEDCYVCSMLWHSITLIVTGTTGYCLSNYAIDCMHD